GVLRARVIHDRAKLVRTDPAEASERAAVLRGRTGHAVGLARIAALDDAGHAGDGLTQPAAAIGAHLAGRHRPTAAPTCDRAVGRRSDAEHAPLASSGGACARAAVEAHRTRGTGAVACARRCSAGTALR